MKQLRAEGRDVQCLTNSDKNMFLVGDLPLPNLCVSYTIR